MEGLFSFFGGIDTKIIVAVCAAVVVGLLLSLLKKAFKAAAIIFAIGFLFAIGKPLVLTSLQNQGVTIDGTVITISENDGSSQSFDAGLISKFETADSGDGSNTNIIVTFKDGSRQAYQAPTAAVNAAETAIQIVSGIASSGYNIGSGAGSNAGAQN